MKSLILCLLIIAAAIVALSHPVHVVGGMIGLLIGLVALVFGFVVSVSSTAFGLIVGGVGAVAGIGFALLPVAVVLGTIALPFVLLALLIRALTSSGRGPTA